MKIIFPLCSLLLLGACGAPAPATDPITTEVAVSPPGAAVTTGPLEKRAVSNEISCTGRIEIPPTDLFSVHARIPGQVSDIRYIPGDFVKKGALLLRISNPAMIEKQRHLLETAANLQLAERELARQETLAAGEATTAEQLDATRGRVDLLRATYSGLRTELRQYGVDLDGLEKDGTFQSSFGVYAPASAFVHEVMVNQGSMITPTDELMELAGTHRKHLELRVPAQQIARLREGQEVRFTIPYDGTTGTARVERINPMIDDRTSTLQVHCELGGSGNERLLPGLFLNATILTGTQETYGLPRDAVVKEGEVYYGFQPAGGGFERVALRDVTVGEDFVQFSNVSEGIWVTGGAYYLGGGE